MNPSFLHNTNTVITTTGYMQQTQPVNQSLDFTTRQKAKVGIPYQSALRGRL